MFEHVPEEVLAAMGERLGVEPLLAQADETQRLALSDGAPLAALLPRAFLEALGALAAEVRRELADPELGAAAGAAAARPSTNPDDAVRRAKVWRRRLAERAARAQRFGARLPPELLQQGRPLGAAPLGLQVRSLAKLVSEHADELGRAGPPATALAAEGLALADAVARADEARESRRVSGVPARLRAFAALKGRLYFGLKALNDAGHELHAHDPVGAARYNLTILYRGHAAAAS